MWSLFCPFSDDRFKMEKRQESEQQQQTQQGSSSSLSSSVTSSATSSAGSSRTALVVTSSANGLTIPYSSLQASMASNQTTQLFTTATPQNSSQQLQQLQFMPQSFVPQQVMGQQFVYQNPQMFPGTGQQFIISTPGQGFQLQLQQANNATATAVNNTIGVTRRTTQTQAIRPSINQGVRPTQVLAPTQFGGQQVLTVVQSQPQLIQPNNKTTLMTQTNDKKNVVLTQNIQPRPAQTTSTTLFPRLGSSTQIFATPSPTTSYLGPQIIQPTINSGLWTSNTPVFIRPQTDQIQYVTAPAPLQFPINVPGSSLQVTANQAVASSPMNPQQTILPQASSSSTATTTLTKHRPLAARPAPPSTTTSSPSFTSTSPLINQNAKTFVNEVQQQQRPVKPKPSPVKQSTSEANSTPTSISKPNPATTNKTSTPMSKPLPDAKSVKSSTAIVTSSSTTTTKNEVKMRTTREPPVVNGHKHIPITPTSSVNRPMSTGTSLETSKNHLSRKTIEKRDASTGQDSVFTPHNRHKPDPSPVLRNGIKNNMKTPDSRKESKSDVLIHVIEEFVIEESPKPFPVIRSTDSPAKENGNHAGNEVPPPVSAPVIEQTAPYRKANVQTDSCPSCHRPGLKNRLKIKDGVKVCSDCAGNKSLTINTNHTSRLGLFNPVTSSLTEYEFSESEAVASPITPSSGPSAPKKTRVSDKTPVSSKRTSSAGNVLVKDAQQNMHILPIDNSLSLSPSPAVNGSLSSVKSPDPAAGLFIPSSGRDPMKWSVSFYPFHFHDRIIN